MQRIPIYLFLSLCLLAISIQPAQGKAPADDTSHASADSLLSWVTANSSAADSSAAATWNFELGGQIFTFVTTEEMHSAGMTWVKMQLTYGSHTTADAQNVINHGRNHGFKVLRSIKGIKSQLASKPTQYYQNFASFLASVAQLGPDAIEVWNEPNIDREWPAGLISGTNYAQMLSRAYPAIKPANANVMVISGAPAPTGFFGGQCTQNGCDDNIFIQQMASAGAASNFDCTGLHYNEGVVPPTQSSGDPRGNPNHYTRYYSTMVSTYRAAFPNKPLCFTEIGYLSPEGLPPLPPGFEWGANTSLQEQADWLASAAQLSRDGGIVRLMVVWNMDATIYDSDPMEGWSIIRNSSCLACTTLGRVMSPPPQPNFYTTNRVPLLWTAVSWATAYEIEIDTQSSFASPLTHETIVNAPALDYTTPALADGIYFWRVRARRSDGTWGNWSEIDSFQVDV